ncbi:MAG: hypothetical protein NTX87_02435 [Planctomycetota bacterium]|nr:hypothetical protein [Planctomycetota bacterium]
MSDPKTVWLDALRLALEGCVDAADLAGMNEESALRLAVLGLRRLKSELAGVQDGLSLSLGPERAERLILKARGQAAAGAKQASDEEVAQAVKEHTGK